MGSYLFKIKNRSTTLNIQIYFSASLLNRISPFFTQHLSYPGKKKRSTATSFYVQLMVCVNSWPGSIFVSFMGLRNDKPASLYLSRYDGAPVNTTFVT